MEKAFYIIRNTTVEPLFKGVQGVSFSGYNDTEFQEGFGYYVWFYLFPLQVDKTSVVEELKHMRTKLDFFINSMPENNHILCFSMEDISPFCYTGENFELKTEIYNYNQHLFHLAKTNRNVKVLDFDTFLADFSRSELIDWRHYYLSSVVINPKFGSAFQDWFLAKIDSLNSVRKKCLVLDLDNTIWGGVLGEDGVEGIHIGQAYPGNCFSDLQSFLLRMKETGVILAICSKNNYYDVEEAFRLRAEMPLTLEDFSCVKANWDDKSKNIIEISQELNIGFDSMVFIDDNPAERELIKKTIPQVSVPEFPDKPYLMLSFLMNLYNRYFQIYKLTDEDLKKTEQYSLNASRKKDSIKYLSTNDFIRDLGLVIELKELKSIHIPRIAQLTQKTNQFNLTTKRYTEIEIRALIKGNYKIWDATVKDKFGDHGITALIIVNIQEKKATIYSFLLSCRILGYEIEKVLLHKLINILYNKGIKTLKSQFVPTSKNAQTEMFFENEGFQLLNVDKNGTKHYKYDIMEEIGISQNYTLI